MNHNRANVGRDGICPFPGWNSKRCLCPAWNENESVGQAGRCDRGQGSLHSGGVWAAAVHMMTAVGRNAPIKDGKQLTLKASPICLAWSERSVSVRPANSIIPPTPTSSQAPLAEG